MTNDAIVARSRVLHGRVADGSDWREHRWDERDGCPLCTDEGTLHECETTDCLSTHPGHEPIEPPPPAVTEQIEDIIDH